MRDENKSVIIVTLAGYLLAGSLLILLYGTPAAQIPAFLYLWLWPALSWFIFLDGPLIERFISASGIALLLVVLVVLISAYLPGEIHAWHIILGLAPVVLAPLAAVWRRGRISPLDIEGTRRLWIALALIILLGIFLRFTNLGYKEFQGDEGVIMVRAASIITGDDAEIFLHQKGPVEILLPAALWTLTGMINDMWSRIPFTWVGLLEILAVFWLARMWFGRRAGIVAALLFTIGGFGIAFSRIVQYQNLVMFWGSLSLISATRYREEGRLRDLILTSAFLGAGLLAHYDAILVLPAVIWIIGERLIRMGRLNLKPLAVATAVGLVILGVFYLPFALSPNAGRTFSYLVSDRVTVSEGGSLFGWSGAEVWQMLTLYNSTWYVFGVSLFAAAGLVLSFVKKREIGSAFYLLVPVLFYLLVVGDPRTHVYTFIPGAVILAGYAYSEMWSALLRKDSRPLEVIALTLSLLWLLVCALYPVLMFLDTSEERQRTWAENRPLPVLYPVTWDEPPLYGLFGFPHQAGWRAALERVPQDAYPYSSNEEEEITNWYMAQAPRTHCADAQTLIIARNPQDEIALDPELIEEFTLQEVIIVNGEPGLEIFLRQAEGKRRSSDVSRFDLWLEPAEAAPSKYAGAYPLGVEFDGKVQLLGYDLDLSDARPGGEVAVTLYWESLQPLERNKQVFVHLYDGTMWAQDDSAPECAVNPTTRWEPGQIIPDPHILELPDAIDVDSVPLLVGMYDLISKERMQVTDTGEDFVFLTDIRFGDGDG
ncbi:MAG: glycosyltransferase family 39 protein [Candidatus Promineifilaceae bacterium]